MTTTPENGPDATPEPVPAPAADTTPTEALVVHEQPPAAGSAPVGPAPAVASTRNGSQTRTILEIVGGVVALGAVAVAGIGGFVFGYAVRDHGHDRAELSLSRAFGDDGPGRGGPGGHGGQGDRSDRGPGMRPGLPFGSDGQGQGQGPGMGQGWGFGGGQGFGGQNGMPGFGGQNGLPGFGGGPDGTFPNAPDGGVPMAPGGGTTSSAPAPS